jgi:type I restriction enzyme M protein
MSEELIQKGYTEQGIKVGNYEYYDLGATNLNTLKRFRVIPNFDYRQYGSRKPDAILVDKRNKGNVKVICVIEQKDLGKFKTKNDKTRSVQQCNDLCQILKAEVGIATDYSCFVWFNPMQSSIGNVYFDETTGTNRSYSIIQDEYGGDFVKEFKIDQKIDEEDITKLNVKTRKTLDYLESIRRSISSSNSRLVRETSMDPTALAKQIWQDVWSVTGKDPEKCLYTFVELFIFKYLSDLNIITEDEKGNKINFRNIIALNPDKAFKNYSDNVRPHLKKIFPPDEEDGTTIINGTVLNRDVLEHGRVFYKILRRFEDFGEMKNINPSFKSKVFEEFMKESISTKNWGRYFTPRNIISSMIEISDIDKLDKDSQNRYIGSTKD